MDPERFRSVLSRDRFDALERGVEEAGRLLEGRVVWNVNSTARGGGVVELLRPLVAYARGAGIDVRWLVIDGTPDFFAVTKRIHNRLHGAEGDGGELDDEARRVYEKMNVDNVAALEDRLREGDVAIVHDPQPAAMIAPLKERGVTVIWRCHIGVDKPNALARETWAFLRPYIVEADAYVFSREAFAWEGLDSERIVVIAPSIDVFSPKNQDLPPDAIAAVLQVSGLVPNVREPQDITFERADGTPGRVERRAQIVEEQPVPPDAPVVVQVSRWDALKDPLGVIRGFAEHVPVGLGAHLVYAAPAVDAVDDDPEGAEMLRRSIEEREWLPAEVRARVHLASLPMDDADENAIMVNALQRHASVVTQKSLAEGFGLTVAEAMWKARPVVASRIGGIQDQIVHGESGILLDDPRALTVFGGAIASLLTDPVRAEEMGRQARESVRDRFTTVRSLLDYLAVIQRLLVSGKRPRPLVSASADQQPGDEFD
jgi:trehalose synthase